MEVNMRRNVAIATVFLLVSFTFSACTPANYDPQTSESPSVSTEIPDHGNTSNPASNNPQTSESPSVSTEIPDHGNISTPAFLNDIGKTLSELKKEYPRGEFIESLDGFPDSAASCFGVSDADYVYYFFGGQSGDFKRAMTEYEDQLKCAGFITTANVLFPEMKDDMAFEDFFSLIGVEDYEYFGEDTITAEGWLRFTYKDLEVMVNTNEPASGGGWNVTGAEIVKSNAPVSIVDPEILNTNQDLAESVMFD